MIQRILSSLLAVLFVMTVFLFTSFLVAAALTAGLLFSAWAWWRSRARRRRVIEGEYRIIESR
jgi:Flp pilus assembly protein TadB